LLFTNVVGSPAPFHFTTDAPKKFAPFTVSVNVGDPCSAVCGETDPTSGTALYPDPVIVTVEFAVLSLVSGSGSVELTVTLFVREPAAVGTTVSDIVALAPFASVPRLH
jgi:hypothetical protein